MFDRDHPRYPTRRSALFASKSNRDDMLITQPACTTVTLTIQGRCWNDDDWEDLDHLQNHCTVHDREGVKFGLITETVSQLIYSLKGNRDGQSYKTCVMFHMPVNSATNNMWEEIDELEARRDRIIVGLNDTGGVRNSVRYRHHLDQASLARYEVNRR